MKKTFTFWKSLFLLCALIVGTSSSWADTYTMSMDSGTKNGTKDVHWTSNNATLTHSNVSWSASFSGGTITNSNNYVQIGSKNSPFTTITLSTSGISGTITQVKVGCGAYNSNATVAVTVGGNAFGGNAQSVGAAPSTSGPCAQNTFSGNASGTIVITITNGSSGRAGYIDYVSVTYSSSDKEDNELAWSAASKNVTYGATPYNLPTLTNPHNLPITYDSSNKSVATIDTEGNVTINNVTGNTTISASTVGDDTYASGTVSYTLNVTYVIEDGVFDFGQGVDYGSNVTYGSSSNIPDDDDSKWTAVNVTLNVAGRNIWNESDGTLRLYKIIDAAPKCGEITLSAPSGNVITQIVFKFGSKNNLVLAENKGTYSSNTWTGAAPSVKFNSPSDATYIEKITVTYASSFTAATVSSAGWATYVTPVDVEFEDNTAYIVTSVGNSIKAESITQVPANTPILLKGEGPKTATVITNPSAPETNLLAISDGDDGVGDYVLYKDNSHDVGFYKWNGEPLAKGKVYLPADAVGNARDFLGFEETTTGINTIQNSQIMIDNEAPIYNLAGQRVTKSYKGVVIVNGKKMLNK